MSTAVCQSHPNAAASYVCFVCGARLCDECVKTRPDGAITCADCLSNARGPNAEIDLAPLPAPPPPPAPTGPFCKSHPQAPAVAYCAQCRLPICGTCDFNFNDIHVCPDCATTGANKISPGRRKKAIVAMVMGGTNLALSVLLLVVSVSGAAKGDQERTNALGCFIELLLAIGIAGLIVAITTFRKNAPNAGYIWIGVVLNGLVVLMWGAIMVLGFIRMASGR